MRSILVLLVGALLVGDILTYTEIMETCEDPRHPGHCLDPDTGKSYPVGATWSKPGKCVECSCAVRGGKYQIDIRGCGPVELDSHPHCRVVEELDRKYPECCPDISCDGDRANQK